ncbi:dihydrofolate reductase family protein [Nemorincola caseinilytica]|uniref:Dihydrofolate reductase family protein n=1 Tax=Nemorincola caseinilytica TaxID=2054315 RepID=A0ABP8NMN5_9BACT
MSSRKVVLYIATSADGYIAKEDGDLGWLSAVEKPGEDYGYHEFVSTVDTVIMGRKTYDKVLSFGIEFPHKGRKCYVWSQSRTGSDDNVTYVNGPLASLIAELKSTEGKDIFIDGGAEVVNQLMKEDLIDRYIISVIPVFIGGGIRLYNEGRPQQQLSLVRSMAYTSGLVQTWYEPKAD